MKAGQTMKNESLKYLFTQKEKPILKVKANQEILDLARGQ